MKYLICTLFAAAACSSCQKPELKPEDYLKPIFLEYSEMLDADSAKFKKLKYENFQGIWEEWCGEVNGKNRLGGYAGWHKFQATVHKEKAFIYIVDESSNSSSSPLYKLYQETCENNAKLIEAKPSSSFLHNQAK